MNVYCYGNGIFVTEQQMDKIVECFIEAVKTELPEEAQCPATIEGILSEIKEKIRMKRLYL